MTLLTTLKFIVNHPLNRGRKFEALMRFIKWQIGVRLNPYPAVYQFTPKSRLIIKRGMTGATGNLYTGLHEYNDMGFLLHFLRPEDLFVDIGANVGSYTVLAGAHVGSRVISIEPVPVTYSYLLDNVRINNLLDNVNPLNIALGAKTGHIGFTSKLDTVNHVATEGDTDIIQVKIEILDNLLKEKIPSLLKIDVEGFETEVINGSKNVLRQESLKAIIIELNGSGERYGYDEKNIHDELLSHGFLPYLYDPADRKLTTAQEIGTHNTIYLRDIPFIRQRLDTADKIKIRNSVI